MLYRCHVFKTALAEKTFNFTTQDQTLRLLKKNSFVPQKLINGKRGTYFTESVLRKHSKLDKDVSSAHTHPHNPLYETNTLSYYKSQRLNRCLCSRTPLLYSRSTTADQCAAGRRRPLTAQTGFSDIKLQHKSQDVI